MKAELDDSAMLRQTSNQGGYMADTMLNLMAACKKKIRVEY